MCLLFEFVSPQALAVYIYDLYSEVFLLRYVLHQLNVDNDQFDI